MLIINAVLPNPLMFSITEYENANKDVQEERETVFVGKMVVTVVCKLIPHIQFKMLTYVNCQL